MKGQMDSLKGKKVLVTGSARRIGKSLALALARAGASIVLHHAHSDAEADQVKREIQDMGGSVQVLKADLSLPDQSEELIRQASVHSTLDHLVNNAAIFENRTWMNTDLESWDRHMAINLRAPFLLCRAYANQLPAGQSGRIVNILDWRALRPGPDHLPYTISKAGLAALTRALASAFAPDITVNGLALGAILPPSDANVPADILATVPAGRWANISEVEEALLFLLTGPAFITGEIIHIDGGRHLV